MNGCELIALPSVEVELAGVSRWPPRSNLSTSGLLSTIDNRPFWKIYDENTIQFLYQEQNYHFCTPRLQVQLAGPSSSPYGQEAAAHRGYHITNGNGNSNERTNQPWLASGNHLKWIGRRILWQAAHRDQLAGTRFMLSRYTVLPLHHLNHLNAG